MKGEVAMVWAARLVYIKVLNKEESKNNIDSPEFKIEKYTGTYLKN